MPRHPKLLLAYYGDDFTGSTDVMEALARGGVRTVLFLAPPTPAQLARFPGLRAYGIAGGSRVMTPTEMGRALPPAFRALRRSGAPVVHYKICSTFDSSPAVGSIGRAIELGRRIFGPATTPLIVGAPALGRHVLFGNLFARPGLSAAPVRLDRHPVMRRHPVTPTDEADVRLLLGRQTRLPVELIDIVTLSVLARGSAAAARPRPRGLEAALDPDALRRRPIALFDTLLEPELATIGRLLDESASLRAPLFCVGSSGVEYALLAHWQQTGRIAAPPPRPAVPANRSRAQLIAVSASCSPVTDRQIAHAVGAGFAAYACDPRELMDPHLRYAAVGETLTRAAADLAAGRSVIFHTARGPEDPRRRRFERAAARLFRGAPEARRAAAGAALAAGLTALLQAALRHSGACRAVVCGGDTGTHVARALGIAALEFAAPVAPGGPLCRVHSPDPALSDRWFLFKGGQVGRDAFFTDARDAAAPVSFFP